MSTRTDLNADEYRALVEIRYQIRRFLRFSELAAKDEGIQPQQYQALLALKGHPSGAPTIGELAGHLQIQPHSAVALVDRLEERELVRRMHGQEDRRQVFIRLTRHGEAVLRKLASAHRAELQTVGPALVEALALLLADGAAASADGVDGANPTSS